MKKGWRNDPAWVTLYEQKKTAMNERKKEKLNHQIDFESAMSAVKYNLECMRSEKGLYD